MLLFGITGGIGCGKTAVSHYLRASGVPVIEADPLAQELTNRLPEIRKALIDEFGAEVFTPAGTLNKEKLSQLIFSDIRARQRVNQIVHPHVIRAIREEAHRLHSEKKHEIVGVEAALIYEAKMQDILDAVVVVSAPLEKRIQWLHKRNKLSSMEILQRIESQIPLPEKIAKADYVIENNGSLADLNESVHKLYHWLTSREKS